MDTTTLARIMALVAEKDSVMVRVEGMKAANSQNPEDQQYSQHGFDLQADILGGIAEALNTIGY